MTYFDQRLREIQKLSTLEKPPSGKSANTVEAYRSYMREYQRKRRATATGRAEVARSNLKATHGISQERYSELWEAQRGCCAICQAQLIRGYNAASEPGKRGPQIAQAHIDHDHGCCPGRASCGSCVRGLLCTRCNSGLALFRDDSSLLQQAVAYLATR